MQPVNGKAGLPQEGWPLPFGVLICKRKPPGPLRALLAPEVEEVNPKFSEMVSKGSNSMNQSYM